MINRYFFNPSVIAISSCELGFQDEVLDTLSVFIYTYSVDIVNGV
jgi:hypothetical protein